ncbi:hypothetical protein GCM10010151_43520 [Actinoallomurus spadix]|uniref:Transposase n=1 Tax=Actinoallomurus spadix TaxID=79912 RepID=A0ABN0WX30_9ACTN
MKTGPACGLNAALAVPTPTDPTPTPANPTAAILATMRRKVKYRTRSPFPGKSQRDFIREYGTREAL